MRELVCESRFDWGVSIREAPRFDTSTFHCKPRYTGRATVANRIREACKTRARHGWRRLHVPLRRGGWVTGVKNILEITAGSVFGCASGTRSDG